MLNFKQARNPVYMCLSVEESGIRLCTPCSCRFSGFGSHDDFRSGMEVCEEATEHETVDPACVDIAGSRGYWSPTRGSRCNEPIFGLAHFVVNAIAAFHLKSSRALAQQHGKPEFQ